jgi:hypothetical protein
VTGLEGKCGFALPASSLMQATQGSAARLQTGNAGNTSEDEADEASYGQHDNRRNGKKPKHPKLLSILIGALIVAERRERRDLLLKSTRPV